MSINSNSPAGQGDALLALADKWDRAKQVPRYVDGDGVHSCADELRALAAHQPVPIELTCGHEGWSVKPWDTFGLPTVGKQVTVYAASPAQETAKAVDLEQLQRYDLDDGWDHYRGLVKDAGAHLYEEANGEWVKWDDVKALIDSNSNS